MIWAARNGHTEVVRDLLEAGANADAVDHFGTNNKNGNSKHISLPTTVSHESKKQKEQNRITDQPLLRLIAQCPPQAKCGREVTMVMLHEAVGYG